MSALFIKCHADVESCRSPARKTAGLWFVFFFRMLELHQHLMNQSPSQFFCGFWSSHRVPDWVLACEIPGVAMVALPTETSSCDTGTGIPKQKRMELMGQMSNMAAHRDFNTATRYWVGYPFLVGWNIHGNPSYFDVILSGVQGITID